MRIPFRASTLYDKEVYTSNGVFVGVVDQLVFDTVQARISALEVITKDKKRVTIPFHLIAHVKDIVLLRSRG